MASAGALTTGQYPVKEIPRGPRPHFSRSSAMACCRGSIVQIPIFSAAGRPLDAVPVRVFERMQDDGRVARVIRRRDGTIARAYLRPRDASEVPAKISSYMGQRYSYLERLPSGQTWVLRRLGRGSELRPIFLQVLSECLVIH